MFVHYTSDDEKAQFDYAMAEMKKIMPNVTLDIDVMPQDSGAKLKTYFATGSLPDIFEVSTSDIATGIASNNIIPLDDYINKFNLADQLSPTGVSLLSQQDGHTWGMPAANTNFAVIFVNKTLFEQAGAKIPENYQELLDAGKKLIEQGTVPLGIWLKETWPALQLFDMAAIPENPKGMTDLDINGTAKGSDPAFVNAANKIQELAKEGLISKDAFTYDYNSAVADFESGKTAMLMVGNWMTQEIGDKLGDGNVAVLLPDVFADAANVQAVKDAGVISGGGFIGGYAVSANSKHKEIAAEYAVQLALKNAEGRTVKTGEFNTLFKNPPASEKPENALQKEVSSILTTVKSTTAMGWAFQDNKIQTDLGGEVQKLYSGVYKPEEFAKNVDAILEKYRK
nr:extracellular solute-binding protein [Cohnella lubricantis]